MTTDPASPPPASFPGLPAYLARFGLLVREETHEGRVWLHLHHVHDVTEGEPREGEEREFQIPAITGINVRFDEFPAFVASLMRVATVAGGITPLPDFAALADQYRFAENADHPCQRNITLARLFAALAAEGDARDSKFLRTLDRVVAEHHPDLAWKHWGAGAPSRTGRGVEATAKTFLIERFHDLCALDDAALDRLVEEHRAPLLAGEPASDPSAVDRVYVIAAEILTSISTAMPHLDPHAAQGGASDARATTVAVHPTVDAHGRPAKLVIRRLPDGGGTVHGAHAPDTVERLAVQLREMRQARSNETRAVERGMFLRPDDVEAVLRKALRIAGLEPSKVEGFFKYLDQRTRRTGAEVVPQNRDQRRRAARAQRKGRP